MWYWENVTDNFLKEKTMNDNLLDFQTILEENSRFDAYIKNRAEQSDDTSSLYHYHHRDGDISNAPNNDEPEILDLG